MRIIYTTAPESYDWFGTKTIQSNFAIYRSQPVRKVEMQDERMREQVLRYLSGMHLAMTPLEVKEFGDILFEKSV